LSGPRSSPRRGRDAGGESTKRRRARGLFVVALPKSSDLASDPSNLTMRRLS
jgi:hypothetical protein